MFLFQFQSLPILQVDSHIRKIILKKKKIKNSKLSQAPSRLQLSFCFSYFFTYSHKDSIIRWHRILTHTEGKKAFFIHSNSKLNSYQKSEILPKKKKNFFEGTKKNDFWGGSHGKIFGSNEKKNQIIITSNFSFNSWIVLSLI